MLLSYSCTVSGKITFVSNLFGVLLLVITQHGNWGWLLWIFLLHDMAIGVGYFGFILLRNMAIWIGYFAMCQHVEDTNYLLRPPFSFLFI